MKSRCALLGMTVAALMAIGFMVSCVRERRVAPAVTVAPRGPEGITEEQARMEHHTVVESPQAAAVFDATWYERANRPRILLLVNRRFAGDVTQWRADSRLVVTTLRGKTVRVGETPRPDRETERRRLDAQVERRTDASLDYLSEAAAARLRALLLSPFLAAGCKMIDVDVVERIAQAGASREEGADAGRLLIDVSTEAFLKEADWIIEVVAAPTGEATMPYILLAKAVDLRNRQVLAVQSTADMPPPVHIPGAPQTQPATVSLDEQARWLAHALAGQLNAVVKQK